MFLFSALAATPIPTLSFLSSSSQAQVEGGKQVSIKGISIKGISIKGISIKGREWDLVAAAGLN